MCDTLVTVRGDGVLFAKNSDRDPNEAQFLDWQPRRAYPSGARLHCTWIEIPQVRQTHAVLLSRPYWMWGAEMGTNEHGVTIGNEAVFTREPCAKIGLTGMDLLRLALERSRTGAEAVRTIIELIDEFGQGGTCCLERRGFTYHNSFLVADPREAFVLETAGRHHAVEEVRGARSISNGLTISGFAERYSDRIKTRVSACRRRQDRTQQLVERADQTRDMVQILRDHGAGENAPRYSWVNGGLGAACVHAGGLIAASQTTGSWVADLRPGAIRHWVTGTAAPCTSLFKPVSVDEPLDLGPAPTNRADEDSLWWRHERLHRGVMRDQAHLGATYYSQRDEIERAWLASPPQPGDAWAEASQREAEWTGLVLAQAATDTRPRFVRRYWARRNSQAGLNLATTHSTLPSRVMPVASH
ncbi:MAG: C69 family dipeptidase [Pirellulales bacterium]|nr:C69 family dipeptidase [Pirellulales bacterium]